MAAAAAAAAMANSKSHILRRLLHHHHTKTLSLTRLISTTRSLSQQPDLEEATPLPPNPSSGSPLYTTSNWRNTGAAASALIPVGPTTTRTSSAGTFSPSLDIATLMDIFAEKMTSQQWEYIKQLFEVWIRSLGADGKPNRPDVNLYNHYLRANLMLDMTAADLLDLVAQMHGYGIEPNAASYNLVIKAMYQYREHEAAEKLIARMLQIGTLPDDETYNLVVSLLILVNQFDSAYKNLDFMLKSGYMVSSNVFNDFVRSCVTSGRLDTLTSFIEKCKATEPNKVLSPSWTTCNYLADLALQADNSKLAFFALDYLVNWIRRGEAASPEVLLSVDEGLVISALAAAGRTYNLKLLEGAWSVLKRSLRQKRAATPESYLAKIYAYSSLGKLERAFGTLSEFENIHGNTGEIADELLSPFTSLQPLVVACCKNGFMTLDTVYVQLENLSRADRPYKSLAALNCVVLGCANIWDLERAYETFESIKEKFELTPDIHSYNSLLRAFGKLKKTAEASNVFEHLVSIGIKPNATTYSLLVDAHLVNRDPKAALAVIDEMVDAGFTPSKETVRKLRRRCSRELDYDSDEKVKSLAQQLNYRMTGEGRKEMLYNLEYSAAAY